MSQDDGERHLDQRDARLLCQFGRDDPAINFIDTADIYSAGESEVIVGKAPAGARRDNE